MAKVVRAFSIDSEVAAAIDRIAEREATWDRKPNKSRVVNQALRWYYTDTDYAEVISVLEESREYWMKKHAAIASNGGVNVNLWSKFKRFFRFKSDNT